MTDAVTYAAAVTVMVPVTQMSALQLDGAAHALVALLPVWMLIISMPTAIIVVRNLGLFLVEKFNKSPVPSWIARYAPQVIVSLVRGVVARYIAPTLCLLVSWTGCFQFRCFDVRWFGERLMTLGLIRGLRSALMSAWIRLKGDKRTDVKASVKKRKELAS